MCIFIYISKCTHSVHKYIYIYIYVYIHEFTMQAAATRLLSVRPCQKKSMNKTYQHIIICI